MRYMKVIFTFIIIGVVLLVDCVHAEISEEDYNRLKLVYSDARISVMSEEEKQEKLQYDLENAIKSNKFYKGISYNNGSYTWTEIPKAEYDSVNPDVVPASTSYETNYKSVSISATYFSGYYDICLYAAWKIMPSARSYDVIGLRFYNVALVSGSHYGHQFYKKIGESNYNTITYAHNGTNIYHQDQGFGISMNLVNDNINALELEIGVIGMVSSSNPHVYGSYQHAVDDVTLTQSKYYTISAAGYGKVINFYPNIQHMYDGMDGVDIALS